MVLPHRTQGWYQKNAGSQLACSGNCGDTTGRKNNLNVNSTRQPINPDCVPSFPSQSGKKSVETGLTNTRVFIVGGKYKRFRVRFWAELGKNSFS